eukprot:jgi/Mesen1/7611/ME000397S06677
MVQPKEYDALVGMLVNSGASVKERDADGNTVLHWCLRSSDTETSARKQRPIDFAVTLDMKDVLEDYSGTDDLQDFFEENFGPVSDAVVIGSQSGDHVQSRGFGFVTFKYEESVTAAVKEHFVVILGKKFAPLLLERLSDRLWWTEPVHMRQPFMVIMTAI